VSNGRAWTFDSAAPGESQVVKAGLLAEAKPALRQLYTRDPAGCVQKCRTATCNLQEVAKPP